MSSGIQFDEGGVPRRPNVSSSRKKGLGKWLVDKGIAKDYEQSDKILLGVVIVAFLLTGFVIMSRGSSNDVPADSYIPAEEEEMYDESEM
jgi:flagellar basal body-associated protein FliL